MKEWKHEKSKRIYASYNIFSKTQKIKYIAKEKQSDAQGYLFIVIYNNLLFVLVITLL